MQTYRPRVGKTIVRWKRIAIEFLITFAGENWKNDLCRVEYTRGNNAVDPRAKHYRDGGVRRHEDVDILTGANDFVIDIDDNELFSRY